jgi:protein-S-isoprenylcysteine O-methyltransferase Ste14
MAVKSAHTNGWQIGEVVFGVPFLLGIGLYMALPAPLYPAGFQPAGIAIGIVLIITGFSLIAATRRELARFSQPTDPGQPTTGLVTSGVFGLSRNPLYLAAVPLFAGLAIALNNLWALGSLVPAVIVCHYMLIAPEESYLEEKFGEDYVRYAEQVNRWLGKR